MASQIPVPRRRGETVRKAVLDAAASELVASGADHVTIADIANRAGVHETSIYRRWITKEALLLETAREHSAGGVTDRDTGSLRGDLVSIARSLDDFLRSPMGHALLKIALSAASAEGAAAREAFWRDRLSVSGAMIDRARTRGEIRSGLDSDLLMQALVGAIHMQATFSPQQLDDERARALVDLLLGGALNGGQYSSVHQGTSSDPSLLT